MNEKRLSGKKMISPLSLVLTLLVIYFVDHSVAVLIILIPMWFFLFRPLDRTEYIMFTIGTLFIVGQNYTVLKSGGFFFKHQDFLLMPYYEPFMWGFYFLNMKRFIQGSGKIEPIGIKAVLGLVVTGLAFSLFAGNSQAMTISTLVSTIVLFILFHDKLDVFYACYALALGFIIEVFGVFSGNWYYPDPDILGIPYWFIAMWISVGILGRRFLMPVSEWIGKQIFTGET